MPFVTVMYLFASLDRVSFIYIYIYIPLFIFLNHFFMTIQSNIGNAKLGYFEKDLHLEGNGFYQALLMFYVGKKAS